MRDEEKYVLDLCDEILGCISSRQHRFDFLRGDPGKGRRGHPLPVDAYYERLNLVIEYCERQHYEPVDFFDRRRTVGGVSRGEQRRIYDQRRRIKLPENDIEVVELDYRKFKRDARGKIVRDAVHDKVLLRRILQKYSPVNR